MTSSFTPTSARYFYNGVYNTVEGAAPPSSEWQIAGTGFGTLPGYQDHIATSGYLESASVGAVPVETGRWDPAPVEGGVSKSMKISDAGRGGELCLYERDLTGSPYNITQVVNFDAPVPANTKVFYSYWMKHNPLSASVGQHKHLRFTAALGISDKENEMYFSQNTNGNNAFCAVRSTVRPDPNVVGTDTQYLNSTAGLPTGANKWVRLDFMIQLPVDYSTPDSFDVKIAVHDADFISPPRIDHVTDNQASRHLTPYGSDVSRWNQIIHQNWFGNDTYEGAQQDIWISNNYLSVGTFKRVELCDTNDITTAKKREIQPVASWADTSISATKVIGSFSSGQTAWLIAIDEDGSQLGVAEVTV